MKKSSMRCGTCIKFQETACRLSPLPVKIEEPDKHWCAQGQWSEWSERYREMEPYFWGEWEDEL